MQNVGGNYESITVLFLLKLLKSIKISKIPSNVFDTAGMTTPQTPRTPALFGNTSSASSNDFASAVGTPVTPGADEISVPGSQLTESPAASSTAIPINTEAADTRNDPRVRHFIREVQALYNSLHTSFCSDTMLCDEHADQRYECIFALVAARKRKMEELHTEYFTAAAKFHEFEVSDKMMDLKKCKLQHELEILTLKKQKLQLEVWQLQNDDR